ncbi:MoaD/ThiS family protein [Streptomyces sp. MCAF7]
MAVQAVESSTGSADSAGSAGSAGSSVSLGPAVALSCRECGERFPLGPIFACVECFGPLEVAYDLPTGDPEGLRKRIEAGPNNIWRYAPLLPVPADVADKPNINPGFTKLVKADNLARELGVTGELRRFVNVYVNDDDVRFAEGLETATPDGAGVSIIPAVAGGC